MDFSPAHDPLQTEPTLACRLTPAMEPARDSPDARTKDTQPQSAEESDLTNRSRRRLLKLLRNYCQACDFPVFANREVNKCLKCSSPLGPLEVPRDLPGKKKNGKGMLAKAQRALEEVTMASSPQEKVRQKHVAEHAAIVAESVETKRESSPEPPPPPRAQAQTPGNEASPQRRRRKRGEESPQQ